MGNINFDLSEQDVIDYFSQVGPVKSLRIVTDRETGKPRGFGFIEFHDIPTAESAVRNLNGSELGGRTIRITFAEGGTTADSNRPSNQTAERASKATVGIDLAYHAFRGIAALLGTSMLPGTSPDELTLMLARKTRSELYQYLNDMKEYAAAHPNEARALLANNPQLAKALFQMEVILGMVSNPLGDTVPRNAVPRGRINGGTSMPPQQPAYNTTPMMTSATAVQQPPAVMDPRQRGAPMAPPLQPAGPRPMISVTALQPPAPQIPMQPAAAFAQPGVSVPPPAAAAPGIAEHQQQLLQQVLSLTPDQIEALPPQQKAQVLALQQQLGR